MQCKDIPERPILNFLAGPHDNWPAHGCGTWFDGTPRPANSVLNAMPPGVAPKLALAKMRRMIRKGLVDGCECGCRGDFEITDKGREALNQEKRKWLE
jgi:hypothetical protein